jgi:hypothetical protein
LSGGRVSSLYCTIKDVALSLNDIILQALNQEIVKLPLSLEEVFTGKQTVSDFKDHSF